jgi:hypothetical protein
MLRANISLGWGNSMVSQLKEIAEMEGALIQHIFSSPSKFLKEIITIMIDESHGRENLLQVILAFNKRTPFMVMNDYRIAYATNSLRRVEIMKDVILKE